MRNKVLLPALLLCLVLLLSACAKQADITDYEVVLAVCCGAEPLSQAQRPLRILIPEAESSMWAYSVVRIEFEREKR